MRLRICVIIVAVLAAGLAIKLRLLAGLVGEETLRAIAAVDAAAAVGLTVIVLISLTAHLALLGDIVRSVRAYLAGRRDHRVPVRGGRTVIELSRVINEVLSHVDEDDGKNPATPAFRRVVRPADASSPKLRAQSADDDRGGVDYGDEVGPVRVHQRGDPAAYEPTIRDGPRPPDAFSPPTAPVPQTYDTEISGPPDEVVAAQQAAGEAAEAVAAPMPSGQVELVPPIEEPAPASTAVEPVAPATEEGAGAAAAERDSKVSFVAALSGPEEPAQTEAGVERRELFDSYVSEKRRLGEPTDELDFTAFERLLDDVAAQLKRERGCEEVRFDVRIAAGKVALQPRLVRQKEQAS
ncbi:MAG: hypothetical protein JXR83_17235 [Deltaproteobacteria bacterium]|nr:hypothetical protein [Deltaproteobacteria bacterium]